MPITTAFIKESIRLANIIWLIVPRKITVDVKLPNGDIMPRGTQWCVDMQRMTQVDLFVEGSMIMNFSTKKVLGVRIHTSSIQIDSLTNEPMSCTLIKTVRFQLDDETALVSTLPCKN